MLRSLTTGIHSSRLDTGSSMVEVGFQITAAFALVALLFLGFNRVVAMSGGGVTGSVPLEQCIEHQSCEQAQLVHGFR